MPAGLKRYYGRNHLHFITTSCYDRRAYLGDPERRDLFVEILEQARQRFGFVVVGYVVMPEHVHLLINEAETVNPSVVMKWVKYRVARRVLASAESHTSRLGVGTSEETSRRDVWGTQESENKITSERFWHHRFYDFNVFTAKKADEKLDYMHMNPVERGLVFRPEDWKWSSARFYLLGEEGPVKLNVGWPRVKKLVPK